MTDSILVGAHVSLTPLTVADAEEMAGVLAGDDLYKFIGGQPPTFSELRATYAQQVVGHSSDGRQEWRNWIIRLPSGRKAVGYVQAATVDAGSRAEIAWVVGLDWQGRGYATDAAQALVSWLDDRNVGVTQAHVHPAHAASAAVARRAGLLPTGKFDSDGEQLWRRSRPSEKP